MILQPLYENAVKHGVYESTESVRITTRAEIIDKFIKISISNTFDASLTKKIGTGTGLLNVARRLEIFYHNKASINTSKKNGVYSVTIYIPKE